MRHLPDRRLMLRRAVLGLALGLALALPAAAAAQPRGAEARKAELDRAFEALRTAPDEAGAALVEARIRALWAQAGTPSVGLLLRRGARNIEAELPGEALEDFDAAITLAPEFAEAWFSAPRPISGPGRWRRRCGTCGRCCGWSPGTGPRWSASRPSRTRRGMPAARSAAWRPR